ncbi:MAG: electron transfer flavoprotein subunit beta/FixA family protein [Oscillospiraceae bacterium]|jgi:electron transfer flavoprotein alpha/beta subunit|nr:electron transfer flavoprotein subunit beta/FixA family protein [Oscillospiraceae bacterium]MDD3261650.1 electron transfer flavoprotein subunit beta/FixA family protein [Oscillospiraceae bacterium]
MNILVCVKQVPDTTEIKIDPVTNTLVRDGVPSIVNPFDGYALEAAARIKDKNPDTKIVVLSMGPGQAEAALRDCLAIAADKAYLASDRAFGGSDTLATSYILSAAVKKVEELEGKFDAIFCGKQAIDGDTAQVGPEMAEHLGYPQVTYGLEASEEADGLHVLREAEDGTELVGIQLPCVVTFTKPSYDPRFPTIKRKMAARRAKIEQLAAADLSTIDLSRAGLKGSPTKVKKTFVPQRKAAGVIIKEETPEDSARKLFHMLNDAHVI